MTTTARFDIHQTITNTIIAAIEAGTDTWRMPWHVTGSAMPVNAESGKAYRGVNVLTLWAAAKIAGYAAPLWATYKQWAEMGAQVRRGEKATCVVFWKPIDFADDTEGDDEASHRFMARGYSVFNAEQVDGFTMPVIEVPPEMERIATAEAFFSQTGAVIQQGGNRAAYTPGLDMIKMPPFAAFCDPLAYYSTLAHEVIHWTGAKSRCDRDLKGRFGSEQYAAEELIAELGAAFLCSDLNLTSVPRPDHAAYIESWLKVLKSDKRAIFTAASKAQAAADWLHAHQTVPAAIAA